MEQSEKKQRPYHSYISKKRHAEIHERLEAMGIPRVEEVMAVIRNILRFDPDDKSFLEYKREHLLRKAAETGLTFHELNGGKAYAERRKQKRAAERGGKTTIKE